MEGCKVRVIPGGGTVVSSKEKGTSKKSMKRTPGSGKTVAKKEQRNYQGKKKRYREKKKPLSPKIPPNRGIYYAS